MMADPNEWLNIQDIFVYFLGSWIALYLALALAGSICLAIMSILLRRLTRVQIVSVRRGEYED